MHLLSSLLAVASEGDCGEVWQQRRSCQLSFNTLKSLFILVTTSKLPKYLSNCSLYIYYKKPVATDCNRFLLVFEYSKRKATGNCNQLWKWATATNGPVAIGCVRSGFGHFFGPSNWTFKHYFYNLWGCFLQPFWSHSVRQEVHIYTVRCRTLGHQIWRRQFHHGIWKFTLHYFFFYNFQLLLIV